MKIVIKNLGALRQAEFELGELTIICGHNNTGKTYATYALFGFLYLWQGVFSIKVPEENVRQLLTEGATELDIRVFIRNANDILSQGCKAYTEELPNVFASSEKHFVGSEFKVEIDQKDIGADSSFEQTMGAAKTQLFSISKKPGHHNVTISLLVEKEKVRIPRELIDRMIGNALKEILFGHLFPHPFIASAERTGAAIFRKELNFARNRILEQMGSMEKDINPLELLTKVISDYALPVRTNVDFTRQLEVIAKKESFVAKAHPDILQDFADIIGGEYTVTRNDELYFVPKGKRVKLSMDESSSGVRSLLDIGFYLRHVAQPGDLLMVDEPELNLHPENQQRVARLFARLVNLGIKVFITTHSDYIIKELNTLIMLNREKPHLKRIMEREQYRAEELLDADRVRVYMAEEALVKIDGMQRQSRCQTLTPADIDPDLGIEARSFDKTIEDMNRIQEEIVWGGEE
jgi:ABC-type branched-subunit amino acid transport system ATPase component